MRKKRLFWKLYPSYLLLALATLLAVGWLGSYLLDAVLTQTTQRQLETQARIIDDLLGPRLEQPLDESSKQVCRRIGRDTGIRVTLLDAQGNVLCDNLVDAPLENHASRPEVQTALAGKVGRNLRQSMTFHEDLLYVAVPVMREGRVIGCVRTAVPLTSITRDVRSFQTLAAIGGLLILLVAAVLSMFMARRISRPLEQMRLGAQRFARGDLDSKMIVPDSEEMAGLADTLNVMARQLEERIRTAIQQKNEREAVLASMVEGVLAVDRESHVISMNRAAADLLGSPLAESTGRSLTEVVRNAELQRFVSHALLAITPIEGDITMRGDPDRFLQAHGAALRDARDRSIGAVVVLHDVTTFRHLENLRRDFVANVSHELKTPITSIKGFVETLLGGAMHDPADTERFLNIIAKQAERLNGIIEDLLRLSKIEQAEEAADLPLESAVLRDVLESALTDCAPSAEERQIQVALDCEPTVIARINAPLLEQALVNLLENAIKYSEVGGTVHVSGQTENGEVVISVADQGCGIPVEHLSRIFERFYRVDKARSRKLGGTGLGLSIVKHIVTAHHGRVLVESAPGHGSVFTIRLPRH
jgi:two-component system phosphate regulon sensor histidine kinase PhoR